VSREVLVGVVNHLGVNVRISEQKHFESFFFENYLKIIIEKLVIERLNFVSELGNPRILSYNKLAVEKIEIVFNVEHARKLL
jgi:hypothetical protein